jgi:hypothetical protein
MVKEEREKMHELNNEIKRSEILDMIKLYKNQIPDDTETDLDFYNKDDDEDNIDTPNVFVGQVDNNKSGSGTPYNPDVVLEQLRHAQRQRLKDENKHDDNDDDDDNDDNDIEDKKLSNE